MHLDPHVAGAAVTTLGGAWLMIVAGWGREIQAGVCTSCAG